jgi:MFS transporter, SP family, sugar:H+ symporter
VELVWAVIFVIMFELGPGPICWLYMSEVMNEKGVAVGTFLNWTFTMIYGLITPILFKQLGTSLTFIIYGSTCGVGFFFVFFFVKETKGLSEGDLIDLYRPEDLRLKHMAQTRDTFTTDNSSVLT